MNKKYSEEKQQEVITAWREGATLKDRRTIVQYETRTGNTATGK